MVPYSFLTGVGSEENTRFVEVNATRLRQLLTGFLLNVEVDEQWYIAAYDDVREAVRAGDMRSAREHYVTAGYFEDRWPRPIEVDEPWYLNAYPDVAEAIRMGKFWTAQHHFQLEGFKEGRQPRADWTLLADGPSRKSVLRAVGASAG
jgi:hypothetical protein